MTANLTCCPGPAGAHGGKPQTAAPRIWPDALYPLLACAAPLLCVLLAHPFANSAFNDDWSYSHVALKFAETGRMHYNGWGSPTILLQTLWGAAWIRIFGFSFDVLRAATMPFSIGFVLLTYALGRRVGLNRNFALFASLTAGTSPLFIPLAATFMTDVYGCFFIAACIYAAVAVAQARNSSIAVRWLWTLVISGIAGGSNRQTVWVAPLVLIPYLLWQNRLDRRLLRQGMVAYATCLTALAVITKEFPQPYMPAELSVVQLIHRAISASFYAALLMGTLILTLVLIAMPALLCFLNLWRRRDTKRLALSLLVSATIAAAMAGFLGAHIGLAPFLGNTLTQFGLLAEGQDALGYRPEVLPIALRFALTSCTLFALGRLIRHHGEFRKRIGTLPIGIFAMFSVSYLLLLLPGALLFLTYDRYLLPLVPLFAITLLARAQLSVPSPPLLAWLYLALYALYGTATTHDYFSSLRARVTAAEELVDHGIARNDISAGLEYDGWTQLQALGKIELIHFNEAVEWNATDRFWFWKKTTAITPEYVVSYYPASMLPPTRVATVYWVAWLPPFRRAVAVVRPVDLPKSPINISGNGSMDTVR